MNNYWEDMDMSRNIKDYHNKFISSMNLPEWIFIDCPFCGEKSEKRSIRNINLCLNSRNIGDVSVEYCCESCKKMDAVYFREKISDIEGFCKLLQSNEVNSEPVLEPDMYKMKYNNLLECMIDKQEE